ncbi:hypothetical protein PspLS_10760 [Pyricularia sp. CBS 133598]|nr:hypothetical protein PspLS_10760 [Pyricularia sp. CBS 133598]
MKYVRSARLVKRGNASRKNHCKTTKPTPLSKLLAPKLHLSAHRPPVGIRAVVEPAPVKIVPLAGVPKPAVRPLRSAVLRNDELDRVLEPAPADAPPARRRLPLPVAAHAPDPPALRVPEPDELSEALQVRQKGKRAVVLVPRRVALVRL